MLPWCLAGPMLPCAGQAAKRPSAIRHRASSSQRRPGSCRSFPSGLQRDAAETHTTQNAALPSRRAPLAISCRLTHHRHLLAAVKRTGGDRDCAVRPHTARLTNDRSRGPAGPSPSFVGPTTSRGVSLGFPLKMRPGNTQVGGTNSAWRTEGAPLSLAHHNLIIAPDEKGNPRRIGTGTE
jgi:hypothetical protein